MKQFQSIEELGTGIVYASELATSHFINNAGELDIQSVNQPAQLPPR